MTTFVTGGTGFVGSAVVRHLLEDGHDIRVLVRRVSDRSNLEGMPIDCVEGDVNDPSSLRRALIGCTALFHVAADYRLFTPDPRGMYRTNVTGTVNVLRTAADAGVSRMVYTSTVGTLGSAEDEVPADETTPATIDDMSGHYKRSKFIAERVVCGMARGEGLPVVIVNPSTPIGPGDVRPTPTGRMIRDAARGRLPAYVDTGLNIVHVDDVARGHLMALERGVVGERYILGGEDLTLAEILGRVADLVHRRPPRLRIPLAFAVPVAFAAEVWTRAVRAGEPLATVEGVRMARKRMFFSSAKAQNQLGYAFRSADEALRDAVAWFRRESSEVSVASNDS